MFSTDSGGDDRAGTTAVTSTRIGGRPGWDQHPGVRTGGRLWAGERVADVLSRAAGSWPHLIVIIVGAPAVAAAALAHGGQAGGWARLAVGLAAIALLEVALVLMVARRAERIAAELALYQLDQARRAAAVAEDLRGEMERLHADVARIAAGTEKAGHAPRRP